MCTTCFPIFLQLCHLDKPTNANGGITHTSLHGNEIYCNAVLQMIDILPRETTQRCSIMSLHILAKDVSKSGTAPRRWPQKQLLNPAL